jgi:hypothetical protein
MATNKKEIDRRFNFHTCLMEGERRVKDGRFPDGIHVPDVTAQMKSLGISADALPELLAIGWALELIEAWDKSRSAAGQKPSEMQRDRNAAISAFKRGLYLMRAKHLREEHLEVHTSSTQVGEFIVAELFADELSAVDRAIEKIEAFQSTAGNPGPTNSWKFLALLSMAKCAFLYKNGCSASDLQILAQCVFDPVLPADADTRWAPLVEKALAEVCS